MYDIIAILCLVVLYYGVRKVIKLFKQIDLDNVNKDYEYPSSVVLGVALAILLMGPLIVLAHYLVTWIP